MYCVFFEVQPAGEAGRRAYLDFAARLAPRLHEVPGFISVERFQNVTVPGWMLSLSQWRDEAALITWRENSEHRTAQTNGREGVFQDYRIRVARQVGTGGDLTLTATAPAADRDRAQQFESLAARGRYVWLSGGDAGEAGTNWQVIRDYGMWDRRYAPRG